MGSSLHQVSGSTYSLPPKQFGLRYEEIYFTNMQIHFSFTYHVAFVACVASSVCNFDCDTERQARVIHHYYALHRLSV